MPRKTLKNIWCLLKETTLEFIENNSFQKGAALAYYTIFALPPILLIIINATGYFFGEQAVSGEVYYQIRETIGAEAAFAVQRMVESINEITSFNFATVVIVVTLFIAATGVFVSLQDSLNEVWYVRPAPKRGYVKLILDRFLSFAMILAIAILLIVSLLANTILVAIGDFLEARLAGWIVYVMRGVNLVSGFVLMTFMFGCIYRFLPDAKIKWRDVWVGALVTSLLFAIGREIIGLYLGTSNITSIYGAAGSVIVILLWVFYTSQIIFFGAVFTFVYSRKYGFNIYPAEYAVRFIRQEIEVGHTAVNAEPGKFTKDIYGEEEAKEAAESEEKEKSAGEGI
ncbi:YihY/virulence factor BrkB family protein [Pontibacter indicus]|uniref:Membrane protein n=1 Tax=Pontibacter indicus TaxID=1317125 RepID=A0A1R3XFC8_9BACT|nr:YihY/virulence factor BrkB family protein [Pontibacter indicus]SIT89538.1 membrane protein [Pontibacter indicus]